MTACARGSANMKTDHVDDAGVSTDVRSEARRHGARQRRPKSPRGDRDGRQETRQRAAGARTTSVHAAGAARGRLVQVSADCPLRRRGVSQPQQRSSHGQRQLRFDHVRRRVVGTQARVHSRICTVRRRDETGSGFLTR